MINAGNGVPARLRELARLQGGIVTRDQAIKASMSAGAVRWAVRRGTWQLVYPGFTRLSADRSGGGLSCGRRCCTRGRARYSATKPPPSSSA